jgi:2-polyprenyl-6-methoxyphenol hydroxylase-like FAD-dependent oxidoreductase
MSSEPDIAIIGAGPGGLACARVLQLAGRRVTVYERESSRDVRSQGGSLDLHADTGQVALAAAGLLDDFLAVARPEGQELRLLDREATVLHRMRPEAGDTAKPEIDRGLLRALYLDSLTPGTVRWGRPLLETTALPGGQVRITFADGSTEIHDLVIGADGAWSKVRPALSAATPGYTGVSVVETGFRDVDTRHPDIAGLTGDGMMIATDDGLGVVAQRNSGQRIRVYLPFYDTPDWPREQGVDLTEPEAVRAHLLGRYAKWSPRLRALIAESDPEFVNRAVHALPVPHTWPHTPGITLLGDAAHLMPPLGLGANLAMLDGTELAQAIVAHSSLDDAVRAYESVMLPRSAKAAEQCGAELHTLLSAPTVPTGARG